METPNSYRDPYWLALADTTGDKLGLPKGLLSSIVTRGERSNADQVSEAGARTVFQIIPATRKAAIDKWGIDASLSPENAAEVAGLLLKDSLARNNNDPRLAVAEYHGGTNRANWGPRTNAYVTRVFDGTKADPTPLATTQAPDPAKPQSTFDRVSSQMTGPSEPQIANILTAYRSGQMPKAASQQFEQDVKDGHIMLPRGESIGAEQRPAGADPAASGSLLPEGVLQAYNSGKMPSAAKAQMEADIRAGLVRLPDGMQVADGQVRAAIPGAPNAPPAPQAEPGMINSAIGTGEAALSAVTGATGGALGMVGGTVAGMSREAMAGQFGTPEAAARIEQTAAQGAQAMTYAPRSQSGQAQSEVLGGAMQQLIPVMGLPIQAAQLAGAARPAAMAAVDATRAGIAPVAARGAAMLSRGKAGATIDPAAPIAPPSVSPGVAVPEAASPVVSGGATAEQIAKTAKTAGSGNQKAVQILAEQASPNPEIIASAERLGIANHLQPDHITTSEAYRQVNAIIKSNPQSEISLAERTKLEEVGKRATGVIEELGGSTDFSVLDQTLKSRMQDTRDSTLAIEDGLYEKIRAEIPAKTEAPAPLLLHEIRKNADNMRGVENLSPLERDALRKLSATANGVEPTYALLDSVRKDIGRASAMKGPYADADTALAKHLFGLATEDQEAAANAAGLGETWKAAKAATVLRKGYEDDLAGLFGKNHDRTFVASGANGLPGAVRSLADGDASRLSRLVAMVPPEMRQQVVASGLSTVFRGARTRGELDFTGYSKWWQGLERNQQAKAAILSNLPPGAGQQLADLANVSKGISDSLAARIKTGLLEPVRKEMMGADTLMESLYSLAKRSGAGLAAEAGTSAIGLPGVGLASGIASALTKGKPKTLVAVDQLIASPEFNALVRTQAGTPKQAAAIKSLARSPRLVAVMAAAGKRLSLSERELFIVQAMQVNAGSDQRKSTLH